MKADLGQVRPETAPHRSTTILDCETLPRWIYSHFCESLGKASDAGSKQPVFGPASADGTCSPLYGTSNGYKNQRSKASSKKNMINRSCLAQIRAFDSAKETIQATGRSGLQNPSRGSPVWRMDCTNGSQQIKKLYVRLSAHLSSSRSRLLDQRLRTVGANRWRTPSCNTPDEFHRLPPAW